jgi:WD40 repeat protein
MLASGGDDQTIRLWEISTGQCLKTLQRQNYQIRSVAFSRDGSLIASGSDDQTIQLWQVGTGQFRKALQGHTNRVWLVAFSPDGRTLASGSDDGTVKLWEEQTGVCLKTLRSNRPYERMNITNVRGLPVGQKATLKALGAIKN